MRALAVVGGGNVFDAAGMGGELEAFAERFAAAVIGVVDGDALAAISRHHGETGHIGGAVADVDHIFERNGALFGGHVVVDVLLVD